MVSTRPLESGGEKTQPVSQKQRKDACMAVLLPTIVIAVGGCVWEMGFNGIIGGDHMINNAYAEESVLLVTNETAKLTASDGAGNDFFGSSVSVYNNTAVIGAYGDDDNGSYSAYVFEKNSTSGNWTQTETVKLTASDAAANDLFGISVSVYNNTAVIGASGDDDNGTRSGSAYVFEKNSTSGNWTQTETAKLTASDGAANDLFGRSVSVYNNTAVISAIFDDDNGSYSGSAYVFEKNSTSGNWTQTETVKLTASDGAAGDYFGRSVSVYNNTAVIGASLDDDNGHNSGSAYIFEKNSTGHWTQKQKLLASDGANNDWFGRSVSVYNNTVVIGATYGDDNGSGSAYVFEKNSTSGNWTQTETVKLTASDGAAGDLFGISVSVYNNTAVIGASGDNDNGSYSGSAYIFEKNSTGHWTQKQKLLASDGANNDWFGRSVSVYNNTAVIGAFYDDDNGSNSGSAYVFTILQAPTAHAGDAQTVDEGDNVTLDGTGSADPNGDTITYAWSQTQGPTVTLSSSTSVSPTFDAPLINSTQAILTFSLTVNDGAADSTPDTVDITVSNVNTPPTANAGADQTVDEGDNVTLDGSATDPDTDDTITYAWSQTQGPRVTLSSSTSVSPTFDAPLINSTQAILTFSLTVNDGAADSTPDTVDITVSNVNTPPTANAGADQTVDEGTTDIQLNGSATDPDTDDTITYAWSQTQGPRVTLSSSTSVSPTFDAPLINSTQAILTFSLTVNDGAADSTPDTVDITVSNVNTPPTANAGADQTVDEGTTDIQLNGSATDPDTDDTITYLWSQTQGPRVTLSSSTSVSPTFDAPLINSTQAILTFSLTVNDGAADSTPDTVDITVSNVNTPPTANAGADQTVDEGTTDIQLNGSATDPDTDDTITYAWSQTQGPRVTLSSSTSVSPTFDAPLINSTQAILTFSLTVNDGAADSTPDTVDITVSNVNTPPTANAGADQTVDEGDNVTLDGSATDPDTDDTITYLWSQTQGPTVTLSSSTSVSPTFDAPLINSTQAILTFSLTVNDGAADSTPDTVDITVSNVNTPPTANAGADQTVDEGTTDIQLNGSATDPDTDDTITYAWSQTQGPTVTLSSSTSVSPTFDAPLINSTQAILTFSLTVNDGAVDSTPDTVIVTILDTDGSGVTNQTPTAHAGDDQTVDEGTAEVTLNGSKSSDPDGDTITYLWSQTQGPTVTLSSSTSVSPTFDAPLINSTQAILTFSLTVNDGAADSTPDTVDITVSNVNTPPTANAGADQTVDEGDNVTLDGTGSADPNGDTITYLWSQTQDPTVTLSSSVSASPTFDAPLINSDQAILTFSLTVNDGAVDSANNDTVIVTILDTDSSDVTNQAPTANAGDPQVVGEGKTVILDGSASTDDKG